MRSVLDKTRALRVGVVLGDTVIDERTLRAPATFSIGRSIRNTIAVPVPGLPRSWPLLTMTEAGVLVRLGDDMDVRVARDGAVLDRRDLEAGAERHRDHVSFVVRAGGHGKITLGEVRVLFQEVALPPAAPRPTLPRAVRGTFADRIDRRLAAFAAVSILGHVGVMAWAHLHDPPGDGVIERAAQATYVPDTVAIIDAADLDSLMPAPVAEPEPEPEPAPATTTAPTATPAPAEPTAAPTSPPRDPKPRPPGTPVALPELDPTRYAEELFADGGDGLRPGDLARRKPGPDLAKQLEELKQSDATASLGGDGGRLRDGGGPRPGTAQDPVIAPPLGGPVKVDPDKTEQVPPGRIRPIPPPPLLVGDLDAIVRKISTTYMPGLQRCYKKELGGDATLAGKITLTFSVDERGRLSDAGASGVAPTLEGCVETLMQKWSFPPVVDADGEAIEVDVKLALQLTPT